jgi:hypothetical protein
MGGITPPAVFDVLADGWTYADWVVGTRTIRAVDAGWPAEGTALHYTVGYGPLRKEGHTRSLAYEPERRLELEAHAWPAGTVRIELRAEPVDGGSLVSIEEHPLRGLAARLHNPAADVLIHVRNVETLRRLERCVRRRIGD